jgi:hypothetical protein
MKWFALNRVIAGMFAGALLAACGGTATQAPPSAPTVATAASSAVQSTSAPEAGSPDACTLLTQQQVTDAAGVDMAGGEPLAPTSTQICTWSEAGSDSADSQQVTLTLLKATEFENGKTPPSGFEVTPAQGLGDEAYYVTSSGLGTRFNVKQGDLLFQLKVGSISGKGQTVEGLEAIEKTLAMDVLAGQ